jgi:hypothetical protein
MPSIGREVRASELRTFNPPVDRAVPTAWCRFEPGVGPVRRAGRLLTQRSCVIVGMALALGACNKPENGEQVASIDQARQTYGDGVQPNPAITYQPDVILVGGGAKSIRYASADGMVWVIDGHAEHAKDLRPGKIMFATSRAAGRVMKIEPRGEDLAVTLGPMQLGDVLREADITLDAPFDMDKMTILAVPDEPYMYRDFHAAAGAPQARVQVEYADPGEPERPLESLFRLIPIQMASAGVTTPMSKLPAAGKTMGKISVQNWEIELSSRIDNAANTTKTGTTRQRISLKIQRKQGLKAGIDLGIYVSNLRFKTHTVYHDGMIDKETSSIELEGLDGMDMDISTGIAKAIGDNQKVRIEVPVEFTEPCPVYGLPLVCQIKFKFMIETALGGNNATLAAASKWDLVGPIGVEQGKMMVPTATETNPIVESVKGISLGVSGVVFTQEVRLMAGIGVPAFFTGPYVKLVGAAGVTHSSALNAGFAQDCRAITVKLDAGGGWGIAIPVPQIALLKSLLKGAKADSEVYEFLQTFYRSDDYRPHTNPCRI